MEKIESLKCTICGSHHLTVINDDEYRCDNCDAIVKKNKAIECEKVFRDLLESGKNLDIQILRLLIEKSFENHINKLNVTKYCTELLRYLPDDIQANFYMYYINKRINPEAYVNYFNTIKNEATITEFDKIKDLIIKSVQIREEKEVRDLFNKFYKNKYDKDITASLNKRRDEIELYSNIERDVFICHSSHDRKIVDKVLKTLEDDGNICWVSFRNIPYDTDNYWTNIENAIKSCNIFLCVSSQYSNQSEDCRKEVEIALRLNKKKRLEFKIDDSRNITLFRNFFTGQWVTNISDLPLRVYEMKTKEINLRKEADKLLANNDYKNAKDKYMELKEFSSDDDIDDRINLCTNLIISLELINEKMYSEAKSKLLQIKDLKYTKDLLEMCNLRLKKLEEKSISNTILHNNSNNEKIISKSDFNNFETIKESKSNTNEKIISKPDLNSNFESIKKRAYIFLDDGMWDKADEYAERLLDIDANNPTGYVIKLLSSYKLKKLEDLSLESTPSFSDNYNYKKALQFSDRNLKDKLLDLKYLNNYSKGLHIYKNIKDKSDYDKAIAFFNDTNDYKDSLKYIEKCTNLKNDYDNEALYKEAMKKGSENKILLLKKILNYKNAKEIIQKEVLKIYDKIICLDSEKRLEKLMDFKTKYSEYKNVDEDIKTCNEEIRNNKYNKILKLPLEQKLSELKQFLKSNGNYKDIDNQIKDTEDKIKENDYKIAIQNSSSTKLDKLLEFKKRYGSYKNIDEEITKEKNLIKEKEYNLICKSYNLSKLSAFYKKYGDYKDIKSLIDEASKIVTETNYNKILELKKSVKLEKLLEFKELHGDYKDINVQIKKLQAWKKRRAFMFNLFTIICFILILCLFTFDSFLTVRLNDTFNNILDNNTISSSLFLISFIYTLILTFIHILRFNSKLRCKAITIILILLTLLSAFLKIFSIFNVNCVIVSLGIILCNILPNIITIFILIISLKYKNEYGTIFKKYVKISFVSFILILDIFLTCLLGSKESGIFRYLLLPVIGLAEYFIICMFIVPTRTHLYSDLDLKEHTIIVTLTIINSIIQTIICVTLSYNVHIEDFTFYPELITFILNGGSRAFYSYCVYIMKNN